DPFGSMMRRVLVSGGTGSFGARLVETLVATTDLDVIVAARGLQRARALAAALHIRYPDRNIETQACHNLLTSAEGLTKLDVWWVVDRAGPFEAGNTRLVAAAIAAGCHYIDLADSRDFVAAIGSFDKAARAANVLVASGASSTPAVTNAVLDE